MAFCTECGHQLANGAKFCYACGASVTTANNPNSYERKIVYDGEIHRCPNCGDILDAYESVCETCGYERRGTKATTSIQELARKLEEIEEQRPSKKGTSLFVQAFSSNLPKTDEQKITLIRNFAIPNTKEDIVEFMILASSNIDMKLYGLGDKGVITASQRAVSDAWLAKFEQAYEKARFTFNTSTDFSNIEDLYRKRKKKLVWKKFEPIILILGLILFVSIFSFLSF